jgi:hypothetical protein
MYTEKDYENFINFLKIWLDWAEGGGIGYGLFYKSHGLCCNASEWDFRNFTNIRAVLREELKKDFVSPTYPFGGPSVFHAEVAGRCMHLNRERITWAQKMVDYKPTRWNELKRKMYLEKAKLLP